MRRTAPILIVVLLAACSADAYAPGNAGGNVSVPAATEKQSSDLNRDATLGDNADSTNTGPKETYLADVWPPVPDREFDMNAPLHLQARIDYRGETDAEHQGIVVEIVNTGSLPARIWQTWNSWGAWTLSLDVRAQGSETVYTIENAVFCWTINHPSTTEIPPGGSHNEFIYPYRGYRWLVPKECWAIEGPVEFRAHLKIHEWEDQREHRVTKCDVYSSWVLSEKPRKWLPDHKTWDMFDEPVKEK